MNDYLKNKKITISFFLWLLSVGLFDSIILLKKENEVPTDIETLFLILTVILGIISFLVFILTLENIFHQKYQKVKASILASFSFIFFIIFGVGLIIGPLIFFNKNNPQIVKTTQASKNTLISSGLKLGSKEDDVKLLQAALSTDKSIYPSGIVSGYYGELTKQAVINFQEKYNLLTTGEVDQQTADKFNEVYGDKTRDYYLSNYLSNSNTNVNTSNNTITQNYVDPDPLVNCNVSASCGGGTRLLKKSICDNSTCCQIGNSWIFYEDKAKCVQDQNNFYSNKIYPTSNKIPVFLSYYGYTRYCPSQNVSAVQSIDLTMNSKKMEWAKNYNECVNKFSETNSCYVNCKNAMDNDWNICTSIYGYTGENYSACTKKAGDDYGNCITKCPSSAEACDWVYLEQRNLSSQISELCK